MYLENVKIIRSSPVTNSSDYKKKITVILPQSSGFKNNKTGEQYRPGSIKTIEREFYHQIPSTTRAEDITLGDGRNGTAIYPQDSIPDQIIGRIKTIVLMWTGGYLPNEMSQLDCFVSNVKGVEGTQQTPLQEFDQFLEFADLIVRCVDFKYFIDRLIKSQRISILVRGKLELIKAYMHPDGPGLFALSNVTNLLLHLNGLIDDLPLIGELSYLAPDYDVKLVWVCK